MHFSRSQIDELDRIYRINLINSISGFKPANLIGTKSVSGIENIAVFSSVVHYGSNPPILGFVIRPTSVPRDTYTNIKENGFYTINHIHKDIFKDAHHTSTKYPSDVSEFDKTTLEPVYKNDFFAPFVAMCKVQLAMEYLEEYHIKVNDTFLILGQIKDIYIDDIILNQDGFVDLTLANTATINGLDGYAFPNKINRLEYQSLKK